MNRIASIRRTVRSLHSTASTINPDEIDFFSRLASQWWDPRGEFALLHRMNPVRVGFIRDKIIQTLDEDITPLDHLSPTRSARILDGMEALDIGCGGGLLAESLARLGARTTGVDASESNIKIAALHASADARLTTGINYRYGSAEEMVAEGKKFDLVCSMEVLEHVNNPRTFLTSCADLVKPGGHLFLSTISRTPLSYFLAIFMAEHALRLVRPGTHDYSKFVKPSELVEFFQHPDLAWISRTYGGIPIRKEAEIRGLIYNPLEGAWKTLPAGLSGTQCNYLFWARKPNLS
ncbi:hypothetical protein BS47DRAFT_1370814 [Hydnum rufescens UP504]|uniref:Ubiquinone biosynthesis O-methyltransferase, mitochondrial n=1 Tax=Hydnum rufescens UP504 TaxID=1448309 RepID=A0A9P6B804_9AGAM|nr:hypothetical protein BS47DRAFT_1370814 [Hydnum rufescens UP504]